MWLVAAAKKAKKVVLVMGAQQSLSNLGFLKISMGGGQLKFVLARIYCFAPA
jgi:hypothetical protein